MSSSSPGQSLPALLQVERQDGDTFTTALENFWGASANCDALARMTLAAAQTCAGMELHSLHASFIELAPPQVAVQLRVERLGGDARQAHRRVTLSAEGRPCCDARLRFGAPADGLAYQGARLDGDLPDPESSPSTAERAEKEGWAEYAVGPVEFRRLGAEWPWPEPSPSQTSMHREWVRPREIRRLDAHQQMAAIVFLSDFYSHWTASDRLAARFEPSRHTALDHAVWIHRVVPWDGWWLLKAVSEVGHGGRMFTQRQLFTAGGVLVASAAHEGAYRR